MGCLPHTVTDKILTYKIFLSFNPLSDAFASVAKMVEMNDSQLGVLIVGHGTRDTVGQFQMRNLACQAAGCLAPLRTELGFLELAEPSIASGVQSLAAMGVKRLITVPVLLFRAGHADRDIPEAVLAAAEPLGIEVLAQTPPLELQPAVLELSAYRYREAIETLPEDCRGGSVSLAMIARGSSSDTAAATMERFAERRCELTPVAEHRVGYVAVRQPNVEQTLDWLEGTSSQILVVQPHLLFEGEVYHGLCADVAKRRERDGRHWLVCKPLGAPVDDFEDDRLARVLTFGVR